MKNYLFLTVIMVFILNGCSKDEDPYHNIKKDYLNGFVQKGPFINGTSISVNELKSDLSQTGKIFNTQVTDNKGSFELRNIELISNFVSFRADGFYFNEIIGEQSASQITLYTLSDISDKSTVNVNLLSHLEKSRVEYLNSQGIDFQNAKIQAQNEILKIFNITYDMSETSELLDISKSGEGNAILLAASLILQGYRSEGELTELLSNISSDIREDGVLSDTVSGSQLINHAVYLDTSSIRSNLENRYSDLGVNAEIPDFEKYIRNFIDSTSFKITESLIEYPISGMYGPNILDLNRTNYSGEDFSLSANLPIGTKLKIKISELGNGTWFYHVGSAKNLSITTFDIDTKSQYFTAIDSDESCDLHMRFDPGEFLIEYFEMGSLEPTRTKIINMDLTMIL